MRIDRFLTWLVIALLLAVVPPAAAQETTRPGFDETTREPDADASRDDCTALYHELEVRMAARRERHAREWRAFEEEYRAAWEAAVDDDERREIGTDYAAKEMALREQQAGEIRTEQEAYAQACRDETEARPAARDATRVTEFCGDPALVDLMAQRFAARSAEMDARQAAERERFAAGIDGETSEEARIAFLARLEAEARALREALRTEETRFLQAIDERCRPTEEARAEPSDRAAMFRMACELLAERARSGADAAEAETAAATERRACAERMRAHWQSAMEARATAARYERVGSWSFERDEDAIYATGRYVEFMVHPGTGAIGDHYAAGVHLLSHVAPHGATAGFALDLPPAGNVVTASGEELRLAFHDHPSGLIRFETRPGKAFAIAPAPHAHVEEAPRGFWIHADGAVALLRSTSGDAGWLPDARLFIVTGSAHLSLPEEAGNPVLVDVANRHREEIRSAMESGRLGAEVTVVAGPQGATREDRLVFDDIAVDVEVFVPERRVVITLASDSLTEGRAFAVNVDRALLLLEGRARIAYHHIDAESGEAIAAPVERAASAAAFFAESEGPVARYHIVEGPDGVQLLVSVPHWSTHRFTLSVDEFEFDVPIPAGFALVAFLAAAWVAVRRRADRGAA